MELLLLFIFPNGGGYGHETDAEKTMDISFFSKTKPG
jgi:hypothetical protein